MLLLAGNPEYTGSDKDANQNNRRECIGCAVALLLHLKIVVVHCIFLIVIMLKEAGNLGGPAPWGASNFGKKAFNRTFDSNASQEITSPDLTAQ